MSKKDYMLIADALAQARASYCDSASVACVDTAIRRVANALATDNHAFRTAVFCHVAMTAPTFKYGTF
jgi:hypothetical protein